MSETMSAFDAHDLKNELRPPELTDEHQLHVRPGVSENGRLPKSVLDRMHGRVRVVTDNVVQVFTDADIYHELVEWLDEVFTIPRSYSVHWVNLTDQKNSVVPHALVVLHDADETCEFGLDEPLPVIHEYARGEYAGDTVTGLVRDGGVEPTPADADTPLRVKAPSGAASDADLAHRGSDGVESGINGWTWWTVASDHISITLDDLRR